MAMQAKGSFTVKMTPQAWIESGPESVSDHSLARFSLDKQYVGDLDGASLGQMLSAGSGAKGSSGVYVAIEKVSGSLSGRKGGFILYHVGTMDRGAPELKISVAPGSGTGELAGLAGTMTIQIADGKHSYEFSYSLATLQ